MSNAILTLTDKTLENELSASSEPVLVDFWAPWCSPCIAIAPALEDAASELAGKIRIGKIDVDINPESAAKFGIRGVPTLIIFKNGQPSAQKVGAMSKRQLMTFIEENL